MDPQPKLLSVSELIQRSLPLSGTSSLTSTSPPNGSSHSHSHSHHQRNEPPHSLPNPSFKTLTALNYPILITGTISLPTVTNDPTSCKCFSFSDDGSSRVCCYVLDFDVKLLSKRIHVLSWNYIPFKCGGSGLLEIIRWTLEPAGNTFARCSNVDVFPLDLSASSLNISRDEIFDARSGVFGRLDSISPVTLVPCTIQKESGSKNVSGFLAEFVGCRCKLCSSKSSILSLQGENRHLFDAPVTVYFFQSALSWHPVFSKLLGNVICLTGLKKKLIYFSKINSSLMFITTEKAVLHRPSVVPPERFPFRGDEIKGKGESGAYTGIVTGVYIQGMVVELDDKVWLLLTDPLLAPPHSLRVGAMVCLTSVHFVRSKFPWTTMLLLGACFKTNISVKSFSSVESPCHSRFQTKSMLGKFIESLVFSARFWLLLTISSFKKKIGGIFSEKEILGSRHKEGLVQMYAKLHLPSCMFRPRHGVFMEFCSHEVCGCGSEPNYCDLKLVPPLSSFINHCEGMWVTVIARMQKDCDTMKNNIYWCRGKSYFRLIRRIMSSEDFGVGLMGTLQISASSGRLQMVDTSGSIDVVVPDLPSNYHVNNVFEVRHYTVVMEGLPDEADVSVMCESESFSCRSIFHQAPSTRGIKPTSIYVHFYMRNTTCLNFCSHLPRIGLSDKLVGIKDKLYHIFLATHKFPATQKFHANPMNKASCFVEAIILPWDLFLPGEHIDSNVAGFSEENLNEHMEHTYKRNSPEDHCRKKPKLAHGLTRTMTSSMRDYLESDSVRNCNNPNIGTGSDLKSLSMDSSHKLPCVVLMRSFNHEGLARPGILLRANYNQMNGIAGKLSGQKFLLEFNSEYFSNYQLLQVGGYYIMKCGKEGLPQNVKNHCHVTGGKTLVTSQTPIWSVSFSCDDVISLDDLLQQNQLLTPSIRTNVVPCANSSTLDLFIQRSSIQSPESCFGDISLHLSPAASNLLKLDMEDAEDGLVKPITISGEADNDFMFMEGALVHSSGTSDPDCRLPQGSLISLQGNVLDVHSLELHSMELKTHLSFKYIDDIQQMRFVEELSSGICIHISKDHHIVKLHGSLSKYAYPIGMGPGVSATFHRVLVTGHNELMLVPVSFIVINSMKEVDKDYNDSYQMQFGSGIFCGKSVNTISSNFSSELVQHFENKTMRICCRVVAIHVLVLEMEHFDFEISQLGKQSKAAAISIPCAGFILDDGSISCCCWTSAERASMLLRLNEETMVKAMCSDNWRLIRSNKDKSPRTANYHLQKMLKKHQRIIIKNYGSSFDSLSQDFTFSVYSSNTVLGSSEENLLKLIVINACCGAVLDIVGTIMDSSAISQLEELSGMDMTLDKMQNIWATEVQYANHRTEAINLIQQLME